MICKTAYPYLSKTAKDLVAIEFAVQHTFLRCNKIKCGTVQNGQRSERAQNQSGEKQI